MMSSGFYSHATSLLGDEDRTEFDFTVEFSPDELLEMLESNARVGMMCQWMAQQMFVDGIEHPQIEKLEDIHFIAKIIRGITFARLHGESMALLLNSDELLDQSGTDFSDFEIYHRYAKNNGWTIEKTSPLTGQPTLYKISIQTEKMDNRKDVFVDASRVVIIKNPKLGETWGGTPSSKKIAHVARLEELIMRLAGIFAMQRAESYQHAQNVPNEEAAIAIETALDKVPIKVLSTGPGIIVEPKSFQAQGSAEDFKTIIGELKNYMANAMNVSRSLMDGASEGAGGSNTLSSSTTNASISYSTIREMQTHFKPFMEEILEKIGLQKNFKFIEPNPMVEKKPIGENNNAEKNGTKQRTEKPIGNGNGKSESK